MTGAGRDGAAGLAAIKRKGGASLVQKPETAQCRSMPEAALATGMVDRQLALEEIVPWLMERYMKRDVNNCR